ncbi:MAG: GGDEF domain-containing protein [Solobacterium sp.]|nr:GGDEF domain-containing protein [Solobacterium sp.]
MEFELSLVYLISLMALFLITAFTLSKFSDDLVRKPFYVVFRTMMITYMIYLVLTMEWSLVQFGYVLVNEWIGYVMYTLNLLGLGAVSFLLYKCIITELNPGYLRTRLFTAGSAVPLAIQILGLLINLKTHSLFELSGTMEVIRKPLYPMIPAMILLYFLAAFAVALICYAQEESVQKKKSFQTSIVSILFIFCCAGADSLLHHVTIFPAAICGAIYISFISMQEAGINSDSLTGMNNRRKAMEYLSEKMKGISETKPIYLFYLDVNDFKLINDGYGHPEGDEALVLVANAIKRVAGRCGGFAARLGGDEFLLAWQSDESHMREDATNLTHDLNDIVRQECEMQARPYTLSVSSGMIRCVDPSTSVDAYMKEADRRLYAMKRRVHRTAY